MGGWGELETNSEDGAVSAVTIVPVGSPHTCPKDGKQGGPSKLSFYKSDNPPTCTCHLLVSKPKQTPWEKAFQNDTQLERGERGEREERLFDLNRPSREREREREKESRAFVQAPLDMTHLDVRQKLR